MQDADDVLPTALDCKKISAEDGSQEGGGLPSRARGRRK